MTEFGVYVHIPFCASKCDYCAFATWTDRHHLIDEYLEAVRGEISTAVESGMAPADTVFVGGGTPTLVPAAALADVISSIPVRPGAEVTVECNPDDVSGDLLEAFVGAGVNRVSVGVQSMSPDVLSSLGRTHDRDNVARAVDAISAVGLPTFNLDLIYGAAGESVGDWEATVRAALELDPPHVSAYGLTVEAGTPLAAQPDRHPTTTIRPTSTRWPTGCWRRRGSQLRGVELGASGPRVAAQPPVLEARELPRLRLRRPLTSRRCSLVERPYPRPIRRAGSQWRRCRGRVGDTRLRRPPRGGSSTRAANARRGPGRRVHERDARIAGRSRDPHPGRPERVSLTRAGRLMANEVSVRLR